MVEAMSENAEISSSVHSSSAPPGGEIPTRLSDDMQISEILKSLQGTDTAEARCHCVLRKIDQLLHSSSKCSAVILPLTTGVAESTGAEERTPNPVGQELLLVLQDNLPQSSQTLIHLVDEIRRHSIADSLSLNVPLLRGFFIRHCNRAPEAVDLLHSVLMTYSDYCNEMKDLVLGNHSRSMEVISKECSTCRYSQGSSVLLDMLHLDPGTKNVANCINRLLRHFHFDLWFSGGTIGSMKAFGERVKRSMVQLNRCLVCRFSNREDVCKLITLVLSVVPYPDDQQDELTRSAMNLSAVLAYAIQQNASSRYAIESFCECMGCRPRPQGGETKTSVPVKLWLADSSSLSFRQFLVNAGSAGVGTSRTVAIKLLAAIIRSQPDFLEYMQIVGIVECNLSKRDDRVDAAVLLEAFATGRAFAPSLTNLFRSDVSCFLLSTFQRLLADCEKTKARQACLRGYCPLVSIDWYFAIESDLIGQVWERIKFYCRFGNSNERPLALKAIGEILLRCLSLREIKDEFLSALLSDTCITLQWGLKDSTSNCSMAVFAVGNIAFGIRERASDTCILVSQTLFSLIDIVSSYIDSSNDKVLSNSIRATGHLFFVALHDPYLSRLHEFDLRSMFRSSLNKLTTKVKEAVGGAGASHLTWKQRSSAKKHGRGACHSLSSLLDSVLATEPSSLSDSQEALAALVSCLQRGSSLDSKFVVSAIGAFCQLEASKLQTLNQNTCLVGAALFSCLEIVFGITNLSTRIQIDANKLAMHLLPIITVLDAQFIVGASAFPFMANLYQWMVQNKLSPGSFEKFSIAFERLTGIDVDIGLQQRFSSRSALDFRASMEFNEDEL
jgi:hypothetical protein